MNPITGEQDVEIGGERYSIRYTWQALSEVMSRYGENPNLFDPVTVAGVAAAGIRGMTPEKIMEAAPPLIPFTHKVQAALQWAYFGPGAVPEAEPEGGAQKKSRKKRWRAFFKKLLRLA